MFCDADDIFLGVERSRGAKVIVEKRRVNLGYGIMMEAFLPR